MNPQEYTTDKTQAQGSAPVELPTSGSLNEFGFSAYQFPAEISEREDLQQLDLAYCRHAKATDLKPCLRCGRLPRIRYRMPCAQVVCKCGAHTAVICDSYEQGDSKQVAAVAWNARQEVST